MIPLSHLANHGRLLFNRVANMLTYPYPQAETVYLMVPICSLQGTQQHREKKKEIKLNLLLLHIDGVA